VTAKYAKHAKKEADWGFPSRTWRISRLNLFASRRRPIGPGLDRARSPVGERCETKPIPRQRRAGRGLRDEGCCTNKPSSCVMPIRRSAFLGGQFCETNPIRSIGWGPGGRNAPNKAKLGQDGTSGGRRAREGGYPAEQSQFRGSARRGGAQGRGTRGNCAKRTQFAADGRRTPSSRPKALAMPPVTGARARNKANSSPGPGGGGSETCETNPIWLVGRRPGKGNAQNEPNSPAAPAGTRLGGRGVLYKQTQLLRYADPEIGVPGRAILRNKANRLEPIVRNKPNLVRRAGPRRGETCETKPNLGRMGDLGNGVSGR
jgi:hypothetical protein